MASMGYGPGRGLRDGQHDCAETNPNERGLGKPCAGKPPARFDEGENSAEITLTLFSLLYFY